MGENSGGLSFAEETLTQAIALRFVGKVGEANGFYGDNPANGWVLSPLLISSTETSA